MKKLFLSAACAAPIAMATESLWSSDVNSQKRDEWDLKSRLQKRTPSHPLTEADLKYAYRSFYRRIDPRLGRTVDQDKALAWLFVMGWKSIEASKFAIADEAFTKALNRGALLSDEERASAHLGRAIAHYNQSGCQSVGQDLTEADKHASTTVEVSFYRGMCLLEQKKFIEAEALFERVVEAGPGAVEEAALFYRSLIWEMSYQYDRAEEGYIAVINQSRDATLVNRSKVRLETIQRELRDFLLERKWWSLLVNVNFGYDSNVLSIPEELHAANYGLRDAASPYGQALLFGEVRPAWSNRMIHQLRYTGFVQHYFGPDLPAVDLASHEVQNGLAWKSGSFNRIGFQLSYNSISLGDIPRHQEYLGIPSLKIFYKKVGTFGDLKKLKKEPTFEGAEESTQAIVFAKVSNLRPKRGWISPDYDSRAYLYSFGYDQQYFETDFFNWGHRWGAEWKDARGKEYAYYGASTALNYSYLLSWTDQGVHLGQDLALQYLYYYRSGGNRRDYNFKSNLTLTHAVWKNAEMQWLASGTANLSTVRASAQYIKYLAQLGITQYF